MWNIIKAQNYQLKRDNITILTYIILIVIVIAAIFVSAMNENMAFSEFTGSMYISIMGEVLPIIFMLVSLVLTTRIAGWDMVDKTINYEIMNGHSRMQVYLARLVAALLWGLITVLVVSLVPTLIITAINGFGPNMNPIDMLLRLLLSLLVYARWICGLICLTFILKNGYMSLIVGFLMFDAQILIHEIVEEEFSKDVTLLSQMTESNLAVLFSGMNAKPEFINGEDIMVYQTALSSNLVSETAATSIILCAVYLLIGYFVYRKAEQR